MIACMVPSRGRPQNVAELIEAWTTTTTGVYGQPHLHIAIDDDDPELDGYLAIDLPKFATLWRGPRRRLGGTLNWLAPILAQRCNVIGFMGDDHRPRSFGWDHQVERSIVAGDRVVYGNDLVQGQNLPTAVFMDSRIVLATGYFVLPGQIHLWMDNYWKTLGEQLQSLTYLPDMIIEHVHPITGKVGWDEHYVANNASHVWENDERIYKEWVATQMPADIAAIRALCARG